MKKRWCLIIILCLLGLTLILAGCGERLSSGTAERLCEIHRAAAE